MPGSKAKPLAVGRAPRPRLHATMTAQHPKQVLYLLNGLTAASWLAIQLGGTWQGGL